MRRFSIETKLSLSETVTLQCTFPSHPQHGPVKSVGSIPIVRNAREVTSKVSGELVHIDPVANDVIDGEEYMARYKKLSSEADQIKPQ